MPVGAVVLDQAGEVIGTGRNIREADGDPTGHAEVVALRAAAAARGEWRLTGCTLVVTLEPCTMCAGALVLARVDRLVFGAYDDKLGAVGSLWDVVRDRRLNHRPEVVAGVLAAESTALLDEFFSHHRGQPRVSEVRRATAGDAGVLAGLLHDFNTEFETETDSADVLGARFARLLARDDVVALLAEDDGVPVGFALVVLRPAIWFDGPVSHLDELYVVPRLRDRGIGTLLLAQCREETAALGSPEMHINVDEVDEDTRRFYERHGFVNVEDGTDWRMLCYVGPVS